MRPQFQTRERLPSWHLSETAGISGLKMFQQCSFCWRRRRPFPHTHQSSRMQSRRELLHLVLSQEPGTWVALDAFFLPFPSQFLFLPSPHSSSLPGRWRPACILPPPLHWASSQECPVPAAHPPWASNPHTSNANRKTELLHTALENPFLTSHLEGTVNVRRSKC